MKASLFALCFVLVVATDPGSAAITREDEAAIFIHGPSTQQLLEDCANVDRMDTRTNTAPSKDISALSYCLGYITGVIDTTATLKAVQHVRNEGYCIPDNATATQLAKVFVKYATAHPEELHYGGVVTIALAFNQFFPCHPS